VDGGVRPVPDALGRVNKLELISLQNWDAPIDVVINCSGVFRDLFINQMNLLDQGVKIAEADEPLSMNYVRKHALQQAEEMGFAASGDSCFLNASGSTPLMLIWQWKTAPGKAKPSYRRCTSPQILAFTSDNPGTSSPRRF